MNRLEKKQEISDIKAIVESHTTALIVHYMGLNVAQISSLRNEIRGCGAKFKVVKNSLTKLAIAGTQGKDLESMLSGPTALVASNDPVALSKALTKFAKDNDKLALIGGVVDSQQIDTKVINSLSTLPSKDELRAKIIGLLNAPATKLLRVLITPAEQVARVVGAYGNK